MRPKALCAAAGAALAVLLPSLAACDGGSGEPAASPAAPVPARASPAASRPVGDGHFVFTVLSLRCGLPAVTGTHSEAQPDGQFCSVRLRVRNADPGFHTYVAARQRLQDADGTRTGPDPFAMAVRRQHETVEVGGHDLIEVEVWYDVPGDARITGVRVSGDRDPAGYLSSETVAYDPQGVLVPGVPVIG
ncbi:MULTISPECIES: DUF4352 domain-containing protein [unclassified Streptomyces]|uniref:DUF4352 domain-containing protein n=1 Tax=unclassified Streptomyces TaxID=2593676 RepID=UPI001F03F798|nr:MULTISPECIES: DUF4352 domain-containing protein [unclassified Streptomyces]MCH0562925.1 DUF4352 domain-containing protein [Streptomyces sp. MUM 2J]MCH0571670.1 DUF4352 domain-containing protein [Streptomyces sp. MUM 136J]